VPFFKAYSIAFEYLFLSNGVMAVSADNFVASPQTEVALELRRRLTRHIHARYMAANNFYPQTWRNPRITAEAQF